MKAKQATKAEIEQELAEANARLFLTANAITRLQVYLQSEKFTVDTTVQVDDVLRRLQNDVKSYIGMQFAHDCNPKFIFNDGLCYVEIPNVHCKLNKLTLPNNAELYIRYTADTEFPADDRFCVPGQTDASVYNTTQTIRMSIFTALNEGLI